MIESKDKLITYLKVLGIKIDSSTFENRIKAQKIAYILQEVLNSKLYDDFNFYIKGPYSRELAVDYFSKCKDFGDSKSNYKPSESELSELNKIKPIFTKLSVTDLEIVASLIYLRNVLHLDEETAEKTLAQRKPHLKMDDIWRGTNTLKELFLTDKMKNELLDSLKDEMKWWDELSDESLKRFE